MYSAILLTCLLAPADKLDEQLKAAAAALSKGEFQQALTLADEAVKLDPKNALAYLLRGSARGALRQSAGAVEDFSRSIELDPKVAEAYDRRGSERFKQGQIAESLADFDKFLELKPEEKPGHWRRGIALYYASRFDEGAKQFAAYEKVDTNDVENAVWHFLCLARVVGIEKARGRILKIGKDRRVPLMEVYALFKGEMKPEDILTAANAGQPPAPQLNQRLFYAHLYLGLYFEAMGDPKRALEHMTKAADEYKLGGYMWDVARVHAELRRKEAKPK